MEFKCLCIEPPDFTKLNLNLEQTLISLNELILVKESKTLFKQLPTLFGQENVLTGGLQHSCACLKVR